MAKRPVAKKAPKRKAAKRTAGKRTVTKRTADKKEEECKPQVALAFFLTRLAVNQKGLNQKRMLDEFINNRAELLARKEHKLSGEMIAILEKVEGGDDSALRDMICLNNQNS